jgi:ribonucleoside-diphosphate reductase beta chain
MGFFSTAESLTANNIMLIIYKHITNPECRQYLLRQAYEEGVHTDTFIYCCDTLGLDPEKVYNMYMDIPSIKKKDAFVIEMTSALLDPNFTTSSTEDMQRFVHDLIGYYLIMEGIFFYAGFVMMLSLLRQNKMVGIGEQFQFILRDESVHLAFGADLINAIVQENPAVWTEEFKKTVTANIMQAVGLEYEYAKDCLPRGILGLNANIIKTYLEYIADRRLKSIHLETVYGSNNPFPWMSEIIDLRKEKNFFEMRVTEYQTGRLTWE